MNATISKNARQLGRLAGLAASTLLIGGCYNVRERIGFPAVNTSSGVNIDGVANDTPWAHSAKFFLEDGTSVSAAFMRSMADANNLYLYFEAEDATFDDTDVVVLAFNPTGGPNDYHRLHIYPCLLPGFQVCPNVGGSVSGGQPASVDAGAGNLSGSQVNWLPFSTSGPPPAGTLIRSNVAPSGSTSRWSVEIQIPRAAFGFPASNNFGMFADIITTQQGANTAKQYSWPLRTVIGFTPGAAINDLSQAPQSLPRWGYATLDSTSLSLNLELTGFNNVGSDPSKIAWDSPPNEFTATIANAPGGTGGEADATNVSATFYLSNFGLNAFAWNPVPATPIPNSGQTIRAQEYVPFSSGVWTPSTTTNWPGSGMFERAFFIANPHQCVEVRINAAIPFSRQFNMDFVAVNSPFEVAPQIATGAWRRSVPRAQ